MIKDYLTTATMSSFFCNQDKILWQLLYLSHKMLEFREGQRRYSRINAHDLPSKKEWRGFG